MSQMELVVRLRNYTRQLRFPATKLELRCADHVILETNRGIEYGTVSYLPCSSSCLQSRRQKGGITIRRVLRTATPEDEESVRELKVLEIQYMGRAYEKVKEIYPQK